MKKTNVITILAAVTSVILLQSFIGNPTAKNAYNKFDPSLAVNSNELNIENMK
jgi:hypothetical protein